MNTIFKEGDLVYSFASDEFFVIIEVHGQMCFTVYSMNGQIIETIDTTLTHASVLSNDYREKIFVPNKDNLTIRLWVTE